MTIFSIGNHIWKGDKMVCKCGFRFSGAGEFRNADAFITDRGQSGVICPKCNAKYINSRDFIPEQDKSMLTKHKSVNKSE